MRFKTFVITIFLLAVMLIVPTTRGWLEKLKDCVVNAFTPTQEEVIPEDNTNNEDIEGDTTTEEDGENSGTTEGGEDDGTEGDDIELLPPGTVTQPAVCYAMDAITLLPVSTLPHTGGAI